MVTDRAGAVGPAGGGARMAEDGRWTVRGVPVEVQQAIARRAADQRQTVGEFVTAALRAALVADVADGRQAMPADVVDQLADLERRLSLVEDAAGLIKATTADSDTLASTAVEDAGKGTSKRGRRGAGAAAGRRKTGQ